MVFYIAYRASEEYKNRGAISKRLKTLGCKRICSSFWEINERKINDVLRIVGENQPILLKKTRDIRRPACDNEGNIIDLGSLVVATYPSERDEGGKIKSLLAITPYIRLCRSVYAFCQNNRQYNRKGEIFNASHLFMLIRESDRDAKVLSEMTIVNSAETIDMLLERVRIAKKAEKVLSSYRDLTHNILEGKVEWKDLLGEEKRLHSEFTVLEKNGHLLREMA